jgi:hypothetical protein
VNIGEQVKTYHFSSTAVRIRMRRVDEVKKMKQTVPLLRAGQVLLGWCRQPDHT